MGSISHNAHKFSIQGLAAKVDLSQHFADDPCHLTNHRRRRIICQSQRHQKRHACVTCAPRTMAAKCAGRVPLNAGRGCRPSRLSGRAKISGLRAVVQQRQFLLPWVEAVGFLIHGGLPRLCMQKVGQHSQPNAADRARNHLSDACAGLQVHSVGCGQSSGDQVYDLGSARSLPVLAARTPLIAAALEMSEHIGARTAP